MTESRDEVYKGLCIFALIVSLFASISAIYVGYRVGATNGHALLVFSMNIMQLIYAVAVFIVNWMLLDFNYDQFIVSETISMYSGVVSTLLSNVLAYAAVYIIYNSRYVPVVENFKSIIFWCSFPGIIISIAYLGVSYPEEEVDTDAQDTILLGVYYYLRIISIAFNFFVTGATLYKIHLISSKQSRKSLHEVALRTLAKRMVLYPIVQALGRSGFAWYEGAYGNDATSVNAVPKSQYDAIIFCVLVTPMISVGYLAIFLFMQPEAMEHFKAMLCCRTFTPIPKRKLDIEQWKKRHNNHQLQNTTKGGTNGDGNLQNVVGGEIEESQSTTRSSNITNNSLTAATLAAHTAGFGGGHRTSGGNDGHEYGEEEEVTVDDDDVILEESSFDTHHQRLTETLAAQEEAIGSWSDSNFEEDAWNDEDLYRIISEKANAIPIAHTNSGTTPIEIVELSNNGSVTHNIMLDQYIVDPALNNSYKSKSGGTHTSNSHGFHNSGRVNV